MQQEKEPTVPGSISDEASNNETLSEIEEKVTVIEETSDKESSSPLSPDGTVDSENNERSPKDEVGPV